MVTKRKKKLDDAIKNAKSHGERRRLEHYSLESTIRMAEAALINTPKGEVINFEDMFYNSTFGRLSEEMENEIERVVKNRIVFDLGAGDLGFSKRLVEMGAAHVVAIDKALPKGKTRSKRITLCPVYFDQYRASGLRMPSREDVAFVSWPSNRPMPGFLDFTAMAGTVIYLGKNTDGNCCAWPEFFFQCNLRKVLAHVPDRRNDLIIYGDALKEGDKRKMLLEEWAGIDHSKQYNTGDALPDLLR